MAAGDPGTRTAPLFTAAVNRRDITLLLIDASGDLWAEQWRVPVGATAAAIEAWAADYQLATQANLYGIIDTQARMGQKVTTGANTDQRNSVADGINILVPNSASFVSRTLRVVAPVLAALDGNTDAPKMSVEPLFALKNATVAAGFGTTGDYIDSAQFTERKERKNNTRVPG